MEPDQPPPLAPDLRTVNLSPHNQMQVLMLVTLGAPDGLSIIKAQSRISASWEMSILGCCSSGSTIKSHSGWLRATHSSRHNWLYLVIAQVMPAAKVSLMIGN